MPKVPMVSLGNTKLKISKLGFGTYDFGVPALNISPEKGGQILFEAYKLGIKLWDTSDDYGSHPHVAFGLKIVPRKEVIVSTKTNAKSGQEAKKSLENSLEELEIDYVDIFLLHFVKSDWIDGCRQVLKELNEVKASGIAKAIGISTHSVAVVREVSQFEEVDVIMAICCKASQAVISEFHNHIPLEDGSIQEMFNAIELAHDSGKGIIAMKVLGGACSLCGKEHDAPPLVKRYKSSIKAIAGLNTIDAMVIGMKNIEELKKNAKIISSC